MNNTKPLVDANNGTYFTYFLGTNLELTDEHVQQYKEMLMAKGGWLDDDACVARLVYVNGRFAPQLSKTTSFCKNMEAHDLNNPEIIKKLSRLTDGFTDELAVGVPSGKSDELTSFKALSKPNHCVGEATSQFAINGQQGTACFAALNTIKTGAVAYVQYPKGTDSGVEFPLPLLLVNAITKDCGADETVAPGVGVTCHPRALIVAEEDSRLSVVQSIVDLDNESVTAIPKLYNGYTQFFIHGNANVTHAYLEETGGIVIGGTEVSDEDLADGDIAPRTLEAARPALKDTHLEAIDAQVMGNEGSFTSTMISIGGSGRVRVALSVSLLRPGAYAGVNGFALTGGAQRTDMKTNIHHMGQRTISRQLQKNMIGGRATGSFRGRIRVEQSAQQTESQQISRTVLLSDRCRAWAVPSLEIVADDVSCTHGATVSDLSDEELFYLRSRGLSQATARNMLMYAFAGDITQTVDPSMLGSVDSKMGLQRRIIERLENLVPRGNRMVKGEFQSS
jgi:Fe-S cluster assembly scaffold protein SufB